MIVYLGEGTPQTDLAFSTIRDLDVPSSEADNDDNENNDDNVLSKIRASTGEKPVIDAIESLFGLPWFHRIWILQEIRFSRSAIVICGSQEIDWSAFKTFKHFNENNKWIKPILPYQCNGRV